MRFLHLLIFLVAGATDGNWTTLTQGVDTNLRGISVTRPANSTSKSLDVIWVSGSNGVVERSNDSGQSWTRILVDGGESLDFRGVVAFDENSAYLMSSGEGDKSRLYKTTDGGASWKMQYTDSRHDFFLDAIVCFSTLHCVSLSDPVDGKFLLLQTLDGEHWTELPGTTMPPAQPTEGAFAASNTSMVVCGEKELFFGTGGPAARVFHSKDSGATWEVTNTPIASGSASSGIFSLACSGNTLVALGGDYKAPDKSERSAAFSKDRGVNWELSAALPAGYRSAVALLRKDQFLAVGPKGEDISTDGGGRWSPSGALNLNAISILGAHSIYAVGPKGIVVRGNF
jgi:photosystem II stability/assembly factor-like uncharacterized protein